ncbi:MAG: thioredoxin family protein [Chitinophagaceae bacterium]
MKSYLLLLVGCIFLSAAGKAQAPKPADEILKQACSIADREKKNVFVIFHASWCGWCKKMDAAMNDLSVKKFFTDNYVVRHLVVFESKGKENLENPGALDLLKKYKGEDQGIPYWLVFDKAGKLLADSKLRPEGGGLETGDNTGCPASEKEVAYFQKILKETSSLNEIELAIIEKRFRQNEN